MELTEEELQAKIDEAKAAALAEAEAEKARILAKNSELLGKYAKYKDLDVDLLQAQADELAKLKESQLTDDERRTNELKAFNDKHISTKQALLDTEARLLKMTKDNAIANALRDVGALQEGMGEAVTLLIGNRVTMSDAGVPMIGDTTVGEYVKRFSVEEGKGFFVPRNSGGGGQGSGGGGASEFAKYFDKGGSDFSRTEQAKLAKKDPKLFKQLAGITD